MKPPWIRHCIRICLHFGYSCIIILTYQCFIEMVNSDVTWRYVEGVRSGIEQEDNGMILDISGLA